MSRTQKAEPLLVLATTRRTWTRETEKRRAISETLISNGASEGKCIALIRAHEHVEEDMKPSAPPANIGDDFKIGHGFSSLARIDICPEDG